MIQKKTMLTAIFRIKNHLGIHARPAAKLAKLAQSFRSEVNLVKANRQADVKSVLDILSLGCGFNDEVTLVINGKDEKKAFNAILDLIETEIGERINGTQI